MPDDVNFEQLMEQIDQEIDRLTAAREAATDDSERTAAHETIRSLRNAKRQAIRIERSNLAGAFKEVETLLRDEAEALGANPFKDVFDRIGSAIGIAAGAASAAAAGGLGDVAKFVKDLLAEENGGVSEVVDRPDPPTKPAAVDTPAPTDEQGRLLASIVEKGAKHRVSAGLLGAVAFVESGFRNVKSSSSSASGPFQFIQSTWKALVKRFGAATGIADADISKVESQAEMAALTFLGYRKALEGVIANPSHAALYLCHFLGPGAAKSVLRGNRSRPIDDALREFYRGTSLGEGFAAKIMKANPQLTADGKVRSVDEVLDLYEARLLDGEARFLQLRQRTGDPAVGAVASIAPPTVAPGAAAGGDTPWLGVALAEKEKGVAEIPGDKHNPAILTYIASTTIGSNPKFLKDETHWCSAFVNWCVTQSGIEGTNSAKARDWHDGNGWGRKIDEPVKGCIVVLWRGRPDHPDRFGHIGFFDRIEGDRIFLLGGNQGDKVSIAPYDKGRLLSYRMP